MKRSWFAAARKKVKVPRRPSPGAPGGRPTSDTQLVPSDDQPIRLGKRMAGA